MKFSLKVFCVTIAMIALSFSVGGYLLVTSLFNSALDRELLAAENENRMMKLTYEAVLTNVSGQSDTEQSMIEQISESVENGRSRELNIVRIYDDEKNVMYENNTQRFGMDIFVDVSKENSAYKIIEVGEHYYLQFASLINTNSASTYYLENIKELSGVFEQREEQFADLRWITLLLVAISGIAMLVISYTLTIPIRRLSKATNKMAEGELTERVRVTGSDEITSLSEDFNHMAAEIEGRIDELEMMNQRQEDFIASFAHELKTPLTSMIGYADMIRSKSLSRQDLFLATNYIFKEGKRLEALSFKLLDLIVLGKRDFEKKLVPASMIFEAVSAFVAPIGEQTGIKFDISYEQGKLLVELDLFQTMIINLVDNARKAVGENGEIKVEGKAEHGGYAIYIIDNGKGISKEDMARIAEPFYMANKSRSRSQGGAGLGLTICAEIAKIHDGKIHFSSQLGKGTTVRVFLKEDKHEEADGQDSSD